MRILQLLYLKRIEGFLCLVMAEIRPIKGFPMSELIKVQVIETSLN